ncbi:hypothetical protein C8F04DRAFT_938916, partial [Mycena alexandri]
SVFSAATFEFGGPHVHRSTSGSPHPHAAESWSILTALGNYSPLHGGHIIIWDLGLVISFPPGASILIPTGVLRYSFVKVRHAERRYSLLQWAGSGIARWFRNGRRFDLDFAVNATRAEHEARESARAQAQKTALDDAFPVEEELPADVIIVPFAPDA